MVRLSFIGFDPRIKIANIEPEVPIGSNSAEFPVYDFVPDGVLGHAQVLCCAFNGKQPRSCDKTAQALHHGVSYSCDKWIK
jgi:hypothetical protein